MNDSRHYDSTPRRFKNEDTRCDYKDCVAFMEIYSHEIHRKKHVSDRLFSQMSH